MSHPWLVPFACLRAGLDPLPATNGIFDPCRPRKTCCAENEPGRYLAGLTERELDVLRWLAHGLTDAEIADKLVISTRTVNAHLRSIYNKLDVTTRTAAVRVAIEMKLA